MFIKEILNLSLIITQVNRRLIDGICILNAVMCPNNISRLNVGQVALWQGLFFRQCEDHSQRQLLALRTVHASLLRLEVQDKGVLHSGTNAIKLYLLLQFFW